jgi:hypothetical protein
MGALWGSLRENFIYPVDVTAKVSQIDHLHDDSGADPSFMVYKDRSVAGGGGVVISWARTYLENRLRMRPAGVVSKKLIGERKIAKAIRSCSFRLA